jgi:hypothetical protein
MKPVILAVTILAGIASGQQVAPRRDIQQILSTKVPHYVVKATNLLQAAALIASDFDLPMGVEWHGEPSVTKEITREWDNATVERILYDTASFDVEYQVQVSNGVVHLRKPGLADSPRNPLSIKVPSFSVANVYTGQAAFKLRDEVNLIMLPRQKHAAYACAGSYGAGADETLTTLAVRDVSVREILDTLLTSSHSVMWLVVFRDEQPGTGFLKTQSISRNTTDLAQPDWDFLAHYSDPVTGSYRGDWKIGLRR